MTLMPLIEHHLEFLSLNEAAQTSMSLHVSKCHIVVNHMPQLIYIYLVHIGKTKNLLLFIVLRALSFGMRLVIGLP